VSNGNNKNSFAIFGLLFGASFWGVVWYPYRLLEEAGISGVASSFYSYLIAAVIASIVFVKHWRGLFNQPSSIIWLALAAGWTNLSYVLAVIDGEVMRVMLLFYLSPLWTLILAHFWLKESANLKTFTVIGVSLLGAFIMLYDASNAYYLPIPKSQSDWLGLSAGFGFALTNIITRKSTHLSLTAKSFAVWLGVILMALLCVPLLDSSLPKLTLLNNSDWLLLLMIGFGLLAATWLVQYGVTKVAAIRASIIFIFELVVAAIASYFLANETMTTNEWVGGALIVVAALFAATDDQPKALKTN
jgi:drug/metabolite transporter (DMT)-like permease